MTVEERLEALERKIDRVVAMVTQSPFTVVNASNIHAPPTRYEVTKHNPTVGIHLTQPDWSCSCMYPTFADSR